MTDANASPPPPSATPSPTPTPTPSPYEGSTRALPTTSPASLPTTPSSSTPAPSLPSSPLATPSTPRSPRPDSRSSSTVSRRIRGGCSEASEAEAEAETEEEAAAGGASPHGRSARAERSADTTPSPRPQLVRSAVAAAAPAGATDNGGLAPNTASVGVQTSAPPPYHLRVLPARGGGWARVAARAALSQAGLAALLVVWALLGAWAFRAAEGPHERERAADVQREQKRFPETVKQLAAKGNGCDWEEAWLNASQRYEEVLRAAVNDGFGEGGGGYIWTFSGCVLFAVSLLTTLGFGAPVPRTTAGRVTAVVFAAVGIPLHLLLALNAGELVAAHVTRLAVRFDARRRSRHSSHASPCALAPCWPCDRRRGECAPAPGPTPSRGPLPAVDSGDKVPPLDMAAALEAGDAKGTVTTLDVEGYEPQHTWGTSAEEDDDEAVPLPTWLQWMPFTAAFVYYVVGVVAFGAGRGRPASACLLFPLDFTATGGVGRVAGALRTCYALYLEGAVLLAATGVALHRTAATRGLTALGLRWRLLTADL